MCYGKFGLPEELIKVQNQNKLSDWLIPILKKIAENENSLLYMINCNNC